MNGRWYGHQGYPQWYPPQGYPRQGYPPQYGGFAQGNLSANDSDLRDLMNIEVLCLMDLVFEWGFDDCMLSFRGLFRQRIWVPCTRLQLSLCSTPSMDGMFISLSLPPRSAMAYGLVSLVEFFTIICYFGFFFFLEMM